MVQIQQVHTLYYFDTHRRNHKSLLQKRWLLRNQEQLVSAPMAEACKILLLLVGHSAHPYLALFNPTGPPVTWQGQQ